MGVEYWCYPTKRSNLYSAGHRHIELASQQLRLLTKCLSRGNHSAAQSVGRTYAQVVWNPLTYIDGTLALTTFKLHAPRLREIAQMLLPACQCPRISAISRTVNLLLAIGSTSLSLMLSL